MTEIEFSPSTSSGIGDIGVFEGEEEKAAQPLFPPPSLPRTTLVAELAEAEIK